MPTKNNNLNMKKREKEEIIDGLLVFANDYLERSGYRLNQVHFDFSQNGNDTNTFIKKTDLSYIQIEMALKACISRGFLKYHYGDGGFQALRLTEEGQGRAISIDNAVDRKQILEGNVSIGTLNASGPTQIGNYNTQNIENIFNSIIEQIENSDANPQEKSELKKLLKDFIAHPLTNTILGTATQSILASLGS